MITDTDTQWATDTSASAAKKDERAEYLLGDIWVQPDKNIKDLPLLGGKTIQSTRAPEDK